MNAFTKYRARALTSEEKEMCFAEARSYAGEIQDKARSARRAGWVVGSVGAGVGVVGIVATASLFPLKRTEIRFFVADKSTGYISESIGVTDAPKSFAEQTAHHYLREYIIAREGYVPQTDDMMFHKTAVMSSPEEQMRYAAWHSAPLSPRTKLGKMGYVRVQNFHPVLQGNGKGKTLVYLVRFDRVEVRGDTVGMPKPWSALIQMQWHPEITMSTEDRQINPGGMQVLAYQADPEPENAP